MTDPLNRNAVARLINDLDGMKADVLAKLAEADVTIGLLRDVANTAGNAITTSATDRQQLHQLVDGLTATMPAFGTGATPALSLLGATRDVTIPLSRPMPADTFQVAPLVGSSLVGKLTATVKSTTKTTVTVTVQSLVASVAAGTVTVICWP